MIVSGEPLIFVITNDHKRNATMKDFRNNQPKPHEFRTNLQIRRMVCSYARHLMKHDPYLSLGDAMRYAWDQIKNTPQNFQFIKFKTVKGEIKSRVVCSGKWSDYYTVKGTGRPLKPGQMLFADAARVECQTPNVLISVYSANIIERIY